MATHRNKSTIHYASIIFILFGSLAVGETALLSYKVAESVCIARNRFASSEGSKLQGPLKAPLTKRKYESCRWLSWNTKCRGKTNEECQMFSRKSCHQHVPKPNSGSPRIVGGTEIVPNAYPSFVRILYTVDGKMDNFCGGTIINQNWVLTANHCIYEQYKPTLSIVAGRQYFNVTEEDEQHVKVDRLVSSPDRRAKDGIERFVDLALLHLEKPLEWTFKVQAAILPTHEYVTEATNRTVSVVVVGRGIKDDEEPSFEIRESTIPAINTQICRKLDPGNPTENDDVKDWEFCLIGDQRETNVCFGDSGNGPLVVRASGGPGYILEANETNTNKTQVFVGVIMWVQISCFTSPHVSGLISVYYHIDWIKEITKE